MVFVESSKRDLRMNFACEHLEKFHNFATTMVFGFEKALAGGELSPH